jgi:DNA-binding HxlR family transcriptional regulator
LEDILSTDVDPVFFADCAARSFFDQVANKWAVMILTLLSDRPTRFNEMRRRLEGVTHKALTQALRRLERNGLIARHILATSPVAVEYSITPLGKRCKSRSEPCTIGRSIIWTIKVVRRNYDARHGD